MTSVNETTALTTMGAVRAYCLREEGDSSRDAILAPLLNAFSSAIPRFCEREFYPTDALTRTFSYNGSGYMSFAPYDLREVTTVRVKARTSSDWTDWDEDTDYALEPTNRTPEGTYLWMRAPELANPRATPPRNDVGLQWMVEITGDWGMSEVPADAELACLISIDWRYKNPSGAQSVDVGELSQDSYYGGGGYVPPLPAEAISLLQAIRRFEGGI